MPACLGVLGDLVEDVVVWLEEPLRHASDTRVRIHRRQGGSAANVAVTAARLLPTVFIGCVGADAAGDALVVGLCDAGVDARVQRRGTTGTIVILVDADGERTMLPDRGAALALDDVDPAWLSDLTHLHLPAYSLATEPLRRSALAAAGQVSTGGGTISVDASSTGVIAELGAEALLDLVRQVGARYLFANADEVEALDLLGSGRAAIPDTVVVAKDGPRPTTILEPGRPPQTVPVPPLAAVRDLTGAGDAFAAGFLAAVCKGEPAAVAAAAGHGAAAQILCRQAGTAESTHAKDA